MSLWIVDFGSQYTQLITRVAREYGLKSEIKTINSSLEDLKNGPKPKAIILSGGPNSIFEDQTDYSSFFENNIPVLGICYGMQLIGNYFGGEVVKGHQGEYGNSKIRFINEEVRALGDFQSEFTVLMSHSDHLRNIPKGFEQILESENSLIAGIKHKDKPIWGLQFHPEVSSEMGGQKILKYFFKEVAKLSKDWDVSDMLEECLDKINIQANENILCAFSGGVDSVVAASIVAKKYEKQLYCFFVDTGLLRPQDLKHIEILKKSLNLKIEIIDAKDLFLSKLLGVSEPEAKRKIIGTTFIDVFEQKVQEFKKEKNINFNYLLQGTLYPDVIESFSPHKEGGKSVTIKSHHNVGGLPDRMNLSLLEPLRFLFKDEVRVLGESIGLKKKWVWRHPFPGPGIGVRIMGDITPEKIKAVGHSDQILFEELENFDFYSKTWQAFTVFLPVKTVGVKGDGRAYENVICLRMVNSKDGMTATWTAAPYELLDKVSQRITNEVKGITRVVYDITSKPPGTIEWE